MSDNNPWGKKETDQDRIYRLEKELEKLKADKDKPLKVEIVKSKKSMGCLTMIGIVMLIGYTASLFQGDDTSSSSKKPLEDKSFNQQPMQNLSMRFSDNGIMEPRWSSDWDTFYLYMKNPTTTVAFQKAICQIGKEEYGIKYNFRIQIGYLKDFTKVGSSYLCM